MSLFSSEMEQLLNSSPSSSSASSSIDSNGHPTLSATAEAAAAPLGQIRRRDFSTDLRLGLSLSTSASEDSPPCPRDTLPDWPPIKPVLRSALAERGGHRGHENRAGSFFVKVYMEGIPIGRKLDLFVHDSYQSLIKALRRMFRTTIICPDLDQVPSAKAYVLTYEDKEGDWMMVGDVPWEFFLATVKKLKITRLDKC